MAVVIIVFAWILCFPVLFIWRNKLTPIVSHESAKWFNSNTADAALKQAVERAARSHMSPGAAQSAVGPPAGYETDVNPTYEWFIRHPPENDPSEQPEQLQFRHARQVMWWIRPIQAEHAHIAGIAWLKNGDVVPFYGIVVPNP
jgi:hypothetical protein